MNVEKTGHRSCIRGVLQVLRKIWQRLRKQFCLIIEVRFFSTTFTFDNCQGSHMICQSQARTQQNKDGLLLIQVLIPKSNKILSNHFVCVQTKSSS